MTKIFRAILLSLLLLPLSSLAEIDPKQLNRFIDVLEKAEREYVEKPDQKEMIDAALKGMLESLDPHSTYLTQEDFRDLMDDTKGEFGGVGIEIIHEKGAIKVITPIDDLPADKAGIKQGDYIVKVDDEYVSDIGFYKSVKKMRGEPGTKVHLTVVRDGEAKPLELDLERAIVTIDAVKSELDKGIAYIRIATFSEKALNAVKDAVRDLTKENGGELKGIILDLRNNPGGLLEQAVGICDYFIEEGEIVSTRGRMNRSFSNYSASRFSTKAPNIPIVALINSGTVSASEIVAGALQDNKRAIILGTTSYGKGSVQTLESSEEGGTKITIARYYTPNGHSIQAEGVEPDIFVMPAKVEYLEPVSDEKRFAEANLKGHLDSDKTKKRRDAKKKKDEAAKKKSKKSSKGKKDKKKEDTSSDRYKKDYQYARAHDLITGMVKLKGKKK